MIRNVNNGNRKDVLRISVRLWDIQCMRNNLYDVELLHLFLIELIILLKMHSRTRKLHLLFLSIFCFGQGKFYTYDFNYICMPKICL